jgi:hypothetical protein
MPFVVVLQWVPAFAGMTEEMRGYCLSGMTNETME